MAEEERERAQGATPGDDAGRPTVSVRGESVLEVEAEIASLAVTVNARDRKRATALANLERRSAELLELVRSFDEAVERVETTRVRVHPWYREGRPSERVDGYVGQVTHTLTVAEFTVLGDLAGQLADRDGVDLVGPLWGLRPDSPTYARARRAAVREAVRRAADYAGALGSAIDGLVELADPGLSTEPGNRRGLVAAAASSVFGSEEPEPSLTLEPQRQVVRARVEARFTMRPPDVAAVVADLGPI